MILGETPDRLSGLTDAAPFAPLELRRALSSVALAKEDAELVDGGNAGDERALEELYVRYREWVVASAYRITRDRDDALDVLQDCFLYFFRKFPGFQSGTGGAGRKLPGFELRAKMKTFLYPVVRNLALERTRKRRRLTSLEDAPAETARNVEDAAPVDGATLEAAVGRLPEGEREVVALRFSDEMKLGEIAEALGVPLGTVKSRLHSALSRLKKSLKKM
jgi:RNA polymerase sigma-70 factor (ECF subfamily)